MCVFTLIYIHILIHIYIYIYIYVHTYVYMNIYIYVYMNMFIHMFSICMNGLHKVSYRISQGSHDRVHRGLNVLSGLV